MLSLRVKGYPDVGRTEFIIRDERSSEPKHYVIAVDLTCDCRLELQALLSVLGRHDTIEITTFGSHTRTRVCSKNDPFILEMLKRSESRSNPMIALAMKQNPILISSGGFTEGPLVDHIAKLASNITCIATQPSDKMESLASLSNGTYLENTGDYEELREQIRKTLNLGKPDNFDVKLQGSFGSIDVSPLCAGETVTTNIFTPEAGEAVLTYMDKNGIVFQDKIPYEPIELSLMKSCKMVE